jgi:hypothetical protein
VEDVWEDQLLVIINRDRLEVFRFVDLPALKATHVIDSIAAGNHLCSIVTARTFHNSNITYFKEDERLVNTQLAQTVPVASDTIQT